MKSTKGVIKKWSAYCGGGASFYLADAQGKGVVVEAKTKGEATKKIQKLLDSRDCDWLLSDDPEPDENLEVGEVT